MEIYTLRIHKLILFFGAFNIRFRIKCKTFLGCLIFLFTLINVSAATKTFQNAGNWSNGGNWNPVGTPNAGDDIIINAACIYDVSTGLSYNSLTINAVQSLNINTTLVLTVANNVTNNNLITISGTSTLMVGGNYSGGTLTFSANGTLNIGGIFNPVTLNASNGTINYDAAGAQTIFTGANYYNLTVSGSGTKTLQGTSTVTNSLNIVSGTLDLNGYTLTVGDLQGNGNITSGVAGAVTLTSGSDNISSTYSGIIQDGSGSLSLTKNGTGILTLSGVNTYTGTTTISSGTLEVAAVGAIPNVSAVTDNGTLDLAGNNTTIGSLAGSGTVTSSVAGAVTLTTGDNTSTIFSGIIQNGSGTVALTKNGNGSFTLSGNNTFSGTTTLSTGTLNINSATAIGSGTFIINGGTIIDNTSGGAIILSNNNPQNWNGDFAFIGTQNLNLGTGAISMNASRQVTVNGGTFTVGGIISGVGFSLNKAGAGTLILSGANAYTGGTTLNSGILILNNIAALGAAGASVTLNGGTLDLASDASVNAYNITIGGTVTIASDKATVASAGITHTLGTLSIGNQTLTIAGGSNVTNGMAGIAFGVTTFSGAPAFTINNPAGGGMTQLSVATVTPAGNIATINGNGNMVQTGVWGATAGGITYGGTGTLTLSQANTYTGTTTLNSGELIINNSTALGTGTFIINGGTIDNTSGALTLTNNNPQNWNGDFVFTGSNNLNLGTGAVTTNANCQVTVSANVLTVDGIISGTGYNLTKAGTGTLTMGANNVTINSLTISAGALTATSGTLNIAGDFINSGTFTPNGGTVNYNGAGMQAVAGGASTPYNNLTFSNGGIKNLQLATTVAGTLTLNSGIVRLSDYNLTLTNLAGVGAISGTGSSTNMIETNGMGLLIFTNTALPNTALNGTYPLGNNGDYNPLFISGLAGSAANRTFNIRVVTGQLFVNGINRDWEITQTNVTGTATLSFQYNISEASSDYTKYQPYTNFTGTWALAPNPSAQGVNPVTSTTSVVLPALSLWTAATPGAFYSYQSGDWDNPTTWTTDPGGTTLINPLNAVPGYLDVVTILTGRTVSLSSNITTTGLYVTINSGGFLNLSAFTFTNGLYSLSGQGTLQLASSLFPMPINTNTFVNAGGGTTEYNANITLPATQLTYNNLTINTAGDVIQKNSIILNGNLLIKQGTFQINDNTGLTQRYQLTISGNVTVNNGTFFTVGTGPTNTTTDPTSISGGAGPFTNYYSGQSHTIIIKGDFTNNGTVHFTNQTNPDYTHFPSNGFATIYFQGSTNNTLTCNGQTDFYNLVLDKGSDPTFRLTVYSTAYSNFRLFGANNAAIESNAANPNVRKALWIRNGTLDLSGLIVIPSLSEGTTAAAPTTDFFIPGNSALILDGPFVIVLSTADSYTEVNVAYNLAGANNSTFNINAGSGGSGIAVLGNLQLNNGYLSTRESDGITYWSYASGQFIMNGGTVDTKQFHNPEGGSTGLISYLQIGGNVIYRGRFQNTINYPTISSLTTPVINTVRATNGIDGSAGIGTLSINSNVSNGFTMSGGTIFIYDVCGNTAPTDAILINCPTSNINVTGGTVQVIPTTGTILADEPYLINSLASFGNFIINQVSGTSIVQLNTNPINVLQNLTLTAGTFDANALNVTIGGNFSIASGTNYSCTGGSANRTIFNGTGIQTFTSGAVTLNTLIINKTATDVLVFPATPVTITIADSLMIKSGQLNDNGNIINIQGGVYNAGNEYGSGKIAMVGTNVQTIDGNGSGMFNNLDLNNTSASATPVSLTASITVNGTLNLVSNKIFVIGSNNLNIAATGSITSTLGFGANCYIQSSGLSGDGGITKTYSASSTSFTFPIGAPTLTPSLAAVYTPGTISITTSPTNWGSVTITPVGIEQPATTTKGVNLTYYWRIKSTGFIGLAANSVTHSYTYNPADVPNPAQVSNYVPARYDESTFTWTNGTNASINTTTHVIDGPWLNGTNNIDGDYTAGLSGDFGVPKKFYSYNCPKPTGGKWSNVSSWSLTSHTANNPPLAPPGASDIVLIGNDDSIYLETNPDLIDSDFEVEKCANLQIDKGSALDIGYNPSCNFSVVSSSLLGNGTFRLTTSYSDGSTYVFPKGDFSDFNVNLGTTVLYITNPNAGTTYWLPQGVTSYGNFIVAPLGGSNIIFANNDVTIYGNLVIQGQNADSWFCPTWTTGSSVDPYPTAPTVPVAKTITIKGNFDIQSGALIWIGNNMLAQNFVVYGDVKVGNWAAIMVWGGWGGAFNQSMAIGGNFINNTFNQIGNGASQTPSYVDFNSNGGIPVTFFGTNNASITNTSGTPGTFFGKVTVNKGTSQGTTLTCNIGGTLTMLQDNWLTLQNGTFIYNDTISDLTISQGSTFTIPSTAGLNINTLKNVYIGNANSNVNTMYLSGKLTLAAANTGTVYIGPAAAPASHNDIEYSSGGASAIEVDGGNLIVNGQIRRNPSDASGILSYTQSNGTVTINGNNCVAPYIDNAKLEVLNTGSQFNMSGGTLTIVRGGGGQFGDLYLRPQTSSVTGGTIVFSPGGAGNQNYNLDANIPINDLTITGGANTTKVTLKVSPLTINGVFTLSDANSTFDANAALNIPVTLNGNFINNGTYTPQKNLTTFNGNLQSITGTTTPNVFYDLNVNPITSLILGGATTVSDNLTISSGTLVCGGNEVSLSGNFTNNGNYTDNNALGTGVSLVGSSNQHVSGSGTFGWLELNNTSGAILDNSITLNEHLTLTLGIFDIKQNLLTLEQNSTIDANGTPFSATKMVTTDGVLSNIGIKKFFTTTVPQTFTYPLGTSGKYTPAVLTLTASGYVGSVRINNVNSTQPSIFDPANALKYYWDVESSGISGFQGSLTLNYLVGDVVGGPESNYQSAWLISPGTSWSINGGTVNSVLHAITFPYPSGTENLSGEYTAGNGTSFPPIVPTYTSNQSGFWNNPVIWTQTAGTSHTLTTGPNGFIVIIRNSDVVTANTNNCSAFQTTINGKLIINSGTFGHNLGIVTGNGTLSLQSGTFPAGVYTTFLDCANNGTIEYGGTGNYTIIADLYDNVPNILFSGTGTRILPDKDLTICNSLKIGAGADNPIVDNSVYNHKLTILSTMEYYSGAFNSGSGAGATVTFAGSSLQTIGGVTGNFIGTNAFNNFEINNSSGLSINTNGAIEVNGNLLLTSGLINTTTNNKLTITNTAVNCVIPDGGSATSYVNGPLIKKINQGDNFSFPIGQGNLPGNRISVSSTQTGPLLWTAQYFSPNGTFNSYAAPLAAVSWDEYWSVTPSALSGAVINLSYYPNSDITPLVTQNGLSDMRVTNYTSQWNAITSFATGDNYNGTVSTSSVISIPAAVNNYTIGSVTTIVPKAKLSPTGPVCGNAGIPVTFSAPVAIPFNYLLSYNINGIAQAPVTITPAMIPYSLPTTFAGSSAIYTLTGFTYNSGAGTGVIDANTVTAYANPTIANAGSPQSVCGITSVTLNGNNPAPYSGLWTILSGKGGTLIAPNNPASQFNGVLPNTYTLNWTISNGTCKSLSNVSVAFTTRPDKPTALSAQSFCTGATINNIAANAAIGSINWYTTNTYPPIPPNLNGSTLLTNGLTYYADAVSGTCISASPLTPVTVTLVSQPTGPTLLAETLNTPSVCDGTNVSATFNSGSGGLGCIDAYQYQFDGSGVWNTYNPGNNISSVAHTSVDIQGQRSGCTVGSGCTGTSWVTLASWTVNARPMPSFTVSPGANTCASTNVTYTTQGGQLNYVWSVPGVSGTDYSITSGGISGTDNTVTLQWLSTGSKTVTVNYDNASGCNGLSAATNTTTVNLSPTATAGPNENTCDHTSFIIAGANATNYSSLSWSVVSGCGTCSFTSGSTTLTPTFTPDATGADHTVVVQITVNGNPGCSVPATSIKNITIYITPNTNQITTY